MKTKILFISGSYSDGGGTANVLTTLVNNLDYNKYDITLFQYRNVNIKKEPFNEYVKHLPPLMQSNRKFEREFNFILKRNPNIFVKLLCLDKYDIIIGWDTHFVLNGFINGRTVSWIHSGVDNLNTKDDDFLFLQNAWCNASTIVAVSKRPQISIDKQFPNFIYKTRVIYNAVDEQKIISMANENIDFHYDFKNKDLPLLCFVGRLDGTKNPRLLIKTLPFLQNKCNIIYIGIGSEKVGLEKIIEKENLQDYVIFADFQSNPYPVMRQATLMCLTSFSETFGMVIAEGMVLGKPFVTTPVGGASEELANNGLCGLVAEYNPEDFAKKIDEIISNEKRYQKMSVACKMHVKQFNVNAMIHNFDMLIQDLTNISILDTQKNKINFAYLRFAHLCILTGFQSIKMSFELVYNKRTMYNLAKFCYYTLNTACKVLFYPAFLLKYYHLAKSIKLET